MAPFIPPYPSPHRRKSSLLRRFLRGWESWIHVLFEKSYTMKMGEIHVPAVSFYIANERSLVETILADRDGSFPKHRLLYEVLEPLVGNSVFSANGAEWREQREMINPAFSHAALHRAFPLMRDAAEDLVARIAALGADRPVEVDPLMTHVAGDIIYRTLFSQPLDRESADRIYAAFNLYQRHSQSLSMLRLYRFPTFGFLGRARRAADAINAVFAPIVAERHAAHLRGEAPAADDILQALVETRHPETGRAFTQVDLMRQISTIFLAGHETAASAMTWSLYLLASCPEIQQAMRDEIDAVTSAEGVLSFEGLKTLSVTRNVFRETLRLYPPVSFLVREVTAPTCMRDKQLKPGAVLVVSPWLVQRNRDNWSEPHGFDPDRFETSEGKAACRHAYLPFGKGPRICVGAGFAQQEAQVVLAEIVRRFQVDVVPGDVPEPISRLTLRAKNGVRLRFTPRGAVQDDRGAACAN